MSKDLLACIHFVKAQRAQVPALDASNGDRWSETSRQHRAALDKAMAAITAELPKVRIRERGDGTTVSVAGVRASSTSGLDQALANWVAAGYRKLDSLS